MCAPPPPPPPKVLAESGAQMPGSGALVFTSQPPDPSGGRPWEAAFGHITINFNYTALPVTRTPPARAPTAHSPPAPHTPRRYKKRNTFHKHWLATGVASMAKGGRPRLHLLTTAPPVSPAAPGSTHLRVGVALTPAKGKRPTASAWALEAHDIGPGGAQPEFNQRSHCHLGCGF